MAEFLQFLFSGLTIGAIYALVALGFTLIYNASDVINFAQGEFVMIGGMVTFFAVAAGVPLPLAALLAVTIAVLVGLCLYGFAIRPARNATAVTLIIITIGASIFLRGVAAIVFDKNFHSYPGFAGTDAAPDRRRERPAAKPDRADRRRRHRARALAADGEDAGRQGDHRDRGQQGGGAARRRQHRLDHRACRSRRRPRSAPSAAFS